MPTSKVKAVSASEAAFICRRALGDVRHWDDALTDMRRGRTDYCGLRLTPYGKYHDGKCHRPFYLLADIKEFIDAALAANPSSRSRIPIQVHEVEIDPTDVRTWQVRKMKRALH